MEVVFSTANRLTAVVVLNVPVDKLVVGVDFEVRLVGGSLAIKVSVEIPGD